MNIEQAKQTIIKLINEYSTRGDIALDTSANANDYYLKLDNFIDMAQTTVAKSIYIKKIYNISNVLPLHICDEMYEIREHRDSDITFDANKAYAFSFFADKQGKYKVLGYRTKEDSFTGTGSTTNFVLSETNAVSIVVKINDEETTDFTYNSSTHSITFTTAPTASAVITAKYTTIDTLIDETEFGSVGQGFTNYKGIIDWGTKTYDKISLVLYGDYYFNVKNYALYNAKYSEESEIPVFDRYITYTMPDKFYKIISADIASRTYGFMKLMKCEWESPDKFMVSPYARGDIRITYAAYPKSVTLLSPDDELEVKESSHMAVCYYAAALTMQRENITAYYQLMQLYEAEMLNETNDEGFGQRKVKMVR